MKNIYLLKDLAQITGHSTHTLKYYFKMGLFEEIGRSPSTNFRFFDDKTVARIRRIRQMRLRKYPLKTIQASIQNGAIE